MKQCYDGYAIAEKDLAMRGPGDFLRGSGEQTVRQSGGVRFRVAELCDDTGLLHIATEAARELLEKSPDLGQFPELLAAVKAMFTLEEGTIN
jgi:ATP-dependent DNA helicase RecG